MRRPGETEEWVYWRFQNGREELGAFGERLWSRIFEGCGMYYIPLKDLPAVNGKGPRLQGNDAILPDFDVSGRTRAYVDSKCKTQPVNFHKANELRHGIDRRCWESYAAVSEINRQKFVLAIAEIFESDGHEWSGTLLMQTLGMLGNPIPGFSNQAHMVYWPRCAFTSIGTLLPLEIWDLSNGDAQPDEIVQSNIARVFQRRELIQARAF